MVSKCDEKAKSKKEVCLSNLRILVTGANGFVGSQLVSYLLAQGHHVCGVVRRGRIPSDLALGTDGDGKSQGKGEDKKSADGIDTVEKRLTWFEVEDICDMSSADNALPESDVLIHLAAKVHVMKPLPKDIDDYYRVNETGTEVMVTAAISAGVRQVIYLSSIKVFGENSHGGPLDLKRMPQPVDDYGKSKLLAEQQVQKLCAAAGVSWTIVRPPLIYGPAVKGNLQRLENVIKKGWPLPLGRVINRRSVLGVGNLVVFLEKCCLDSRASDRVVLLDDGKPVSTADLCCFIGEGLNKPAKLLNFPVPILRLLLECMGYRETFDKLCGDLYMDTRETLVEMEWQAPYTTRQLIMRMYHSEN